MITDRQKAGLALAAKNRIIKLLTTDFESDYEFHDGYFEDVAWDIFEGFNAPAGRPPLPPEAQDEAWDIFLAEMKAAAKVAAEALQ